MKRTIRPIFNNTGPLIIGMSAAGFAITPAVASFSLNDHLGTSITEIASSLEGDGYEIREIEVSKNRIEVETIYGGKELEIEVDGQTGRIVKMQFDG